jgi:hypothetical protein
MNFLEALEANKTKTVRQHNTIVCGLQIYTDWAPGKLAKKSKFSIDEIESIWFALEEKKPVVRWLWAKDHNCYFEDRFYSEDELLKARSTLHGFIKLEWSRTEFPE